MSKLFGPLRKTGRKRNEKGFCDIFGRTFLQELLFRALAYIAKHTTRLAETPDDPQGFRIELEELKTNKVRITVDFENTGKKRQALVPKTDPGPRDLEAMTSWRADPMMLDFKELHPGRLAPPLTTIRTNWGLKKNEKQEL